MSSSKLRIGYIPEHFSTPLAFAKKHYGLEADLQPVPTGTGALAARLKGQGDEEPLDVAIGLTEGFVADLGKTKAAGQDPGYGLVGNYVETSLLWAIVVGSKRDDVNDVNDLKNGSVAVSRIGSGSYVMSYVLADSKNWLSPGQDPFKVVPIGDFAALRKSINDGSADFFMWEHFTTRKYWENGEVKRIGDIETPWPSWVIAARDTAKPSLSDLFEKLNQGVSHFNANPEEAVEYITSTMHYSESDAREWMETVRFPKDVTGVSNAMVKDTISVLQKAGVLKDDAGGPDHMISIKRGSA